MKKIKDNARAYILGRKLPAFQYDFRILFGIAAFALGIMLIWCSYSPPVLLACPYVTAKFGYQNRFKASVLAHCAKAARIMDPTVPLTCLYELPKYATQNAAFERHMRFLSNPDDVSARGGGYWFWKSVIMNHTLHHTRPNDVVVYSDIDRNDIFSATVQIGCIQRITGDVDMMIEQMHHREDHWSKGDILSYFNATPLQRSSGQYCANFWAVRNTPRMRHFMEKWVGLVSNWQLVSDAASAHQNANEFCENRHDQSLLSMLIKTHMHVVGTVPCGQLLQFNKHARATIRDKQRVSTRGRGLSPRRHHPVAVRN